MKILSTHAESLPCFRYLADRHEPATEVVVYVLTTGFLGERSMEEKDTFSDMAVYKAAVERETYELSLTDLSLKRAMEAFVGFSGTKCNLAEASSVWPALNRDNYRA